MSKSDEPRAMELAPIAEAQLQLLGKLLDGDDVQRRPVNVLENVEDTDCDWAEPATDSWCQERCVS